jgi:NAD-dependent histone deacetylase SIR2
MSRLTKDAKPTEFHHMLATIAKEDRLLRLYSQNVDGIDTSIEPLQTSVPLRKDEHGKWPRTVQLHGGLGKMVCSKCHELSDFDANLFSGPVPPLCPRCEEINDIRTNHEGKRSHGIGRLRPRMVLYNEHNPDDVAIGKVTQDDLRRRPDAVIVAGTTLKVPGVRRIVREMCGVVRDRRGGVAIWINNDPPPVAKDLEDCFDIIVQGPCDEVAKHAAMRRWWEPAEDDNFSEVSDEEMRKAEAKTTVEVQVSRCRLTHANLLALPTQKHFNNSFMVPEISCTPKRPLLSPEDWSPITSRRQSVMPSIETEGDTITLSQTGLLTPTKSQKGSPSKKMSPIKKLVLKDSGNAKKPVGRPPMAAKNKKPNVKFVKPAHSKPKGKPGPKPKPKTNQPPAKATSLMNTFKATKTATVEAKATLKKPASPSKLRQMSNASAEPMQTVPPQDHRNNLSPSKARAVFPGLMNENATQLEKESGRKRAFSIAELTS